MVLFTTFSRYDNLPPELDFLNYIRRDMNMHKCPRYNGKTSFCKSYSIVKVRSLMANEVGKLRKI